MSMESELPERSDWKEFTVGSWWELVRTLSDHLYRFLAQVRRHRGARTGSLLLAAGETEGLSCVVWRHDDPTRRPRAWVVVEFRQGAPLSRDSEGRAIWKREVSVEARLPKAHVRESTETRWRTHRIEGVTPGWVERIGREPRPRRIPLRPEEALRALRRAEQERLQHHPERGPLAPPRIWIDPRRTPREVTIFSLLLILWQERMVEFGPEASPDAWAWVKQTLRTRHDARLWEILSTMRDHYVQADDWRGFRKYLGRVIAAGRRRRP